MIIETMTNREISAEIDRDLLIVRQRVYPLVNKYRKLGNRTKPKQHVVYLNSKTSVTYNNNKHYFICGADSKGFLFDHFIFNNKRLISVRDCGPHIILTAHFLKRFRERCSFDVNTFGILISLTKIFRPSNVLKLNEDVYIAGYDNKYMVLKYEDGLYIAITYIEGNLTNFQQNILEECKNI